MISIAAKESGGKYVILWCVAEYIVVVCSAMVACVPTYDI
jgi:hypothetical protein